MPDTVTLSLPMMRVISLGWGVQSFALAAMSALGVLPKVDAAVHADTGHERAETYALAEKWTPWLEERGVRVVTVRGGRSLMGMEGVGEGYTSIPAYTTRLAETGEEKGMLRRQCTGDWKIDPIRRWCSAELKRRGLKKSPDIVEQWLGITLDEVLRIKPSGVKYVTLTYPFVEELDEPTEINRCWTRGMVIRWLRETGLEIPVKSSCVFCPYRDSQTWREIKLNGNGDWEKAIAADEAIRHERPGYLCYVNRQRKPLDECDFRNQEDHGQMMLWDAEECSGMCFL